MKNRSDLLIPEFRALSARLGSDPLQVQGPGGNTSIKDGEVMWIKASGTELANAETQDIFVAVDRNAAKAEASGRHAKPKSKPKPTAGTRSQMQSQANGGHTKPKPKPKPKPSQRRAHECQSQNQRQSRSQSQSQSQANGGHTKAPEQQEEQQQHLKSGNRLGKIRARDIRYRPSEAQRSPAQIQIKQHHERHHEQHQEQHHERVQGSDRARLNRRCNSVVPVVEALKKMNVSRIVAESVRY